MAPPDVHDYPAEKQPTRPGRRRDLRKARDKGHHVGLYAERSSGTAAVTRMRQAYALLGLCEK
ncbi:MAG: hypothetical protein IPG04_43495 [Polyangiaceae bacterium]|nr:hypothetical protein [Polyangiaceae bacterium]